MIAGDPLSAASGPARTWGLELDGRDALVGPLSGFRRHDPAITVTVVPADTVTEGEPSGRTEVEESAAAFAVDYYRFENREGLYHHGGGNWILWNRDQTRFLVSGQPSWPTTWVHVRFLLRHLIISRLISLPGHHCLHAVGARSGDGRGLLVAGPSGSGKTRLMNRLVEAGLVDDVVEDDCAVIDSGWKMTSLIPTQHELRRPRTLDIAAVILLDSRVSKPQPTAPRAAADFAAACPTPWPAPWLPGATRRSTRIENPPEELRVLRVSPRSDADDVVLDAVATFWAG